MYDKFVFNKKTITLFEAFSGIGAFHKGLTILSNERDFTLDIVGISEIDKYAIAAYNEIHGETKNYGSICDIQEIPQVDIFTYSFPCQDISLAGKGKGFSKGSGTRSGLLWEVERILENQEKIGKLPQVLVMENVKALVGIKFKDDYIEWQLKLEELGYRNYWEVLNAKNYGIPQNRERVFMVSILGEYHYTFPKPFPLKLRLKDMLETEVDKKYYLSDKQMKQLKSTPHEKSSISRVKNPNEDLCNSIDTMGGGNREPKIFCSYALGSREHEAQGWKEIMPTLAARDYKDPKVVMVKGNIKNINKDDGIMSTLGTNCGSSTSAGGGVIVYDDYNSKIRKDQNTIGALTPNIGNSAPRNSYKLIENNRAITAIIGNAQKNCYKGDGSISPTLVSAMGMGGGQVPMMTFENLRIRKLTPKECYRLMGFTDSDFEKATSVISNSQLYKTAGNSIVVDVIYYLFKEMIK
jgi:DNA (cytosine-5)-methyltransferase 1